MRKWVIYILFLAGTTLISVTNSCAQKKTPNIILFLVDDMGWQDCSVPFYRERTKWNNIYHTPNMESLAAQGMKFTHAFANQNCTPTRVSLMTGMNPVNHGVNSWTLNKNQSPEARPEHFLQPPDWNMNGLSPVGGIEHTVYVTPLPAVLKKKGYITIHTGKGHFGAFDTPGADPLHLGFDINIGGTAAGHPASYYGLDSFGNKKNNPAKRAVPGLEKFWGQDIYLTEALTRRTLSVLDSVGATKTPFFLYFSHYAVHAPLQADSRFVQQYYDRGMDSVEARYAAMIEGMDKSLGDVMDYLEKNGLVDNTVLIFLSDNGGLTDVIRGGVRNFHNSPLRSGKTSGYDGGLRVPMIVRWPGTIRAGSVCDINVIVEDLFTTIRRLGGAGEIPVVQKTDGLDLIPLFYGEKRYYDRVLTWHHPHYMTGRAADIYPFSAVRMGKWKLIYSHVTMKSELYDTETDIGEEHNLIAEEKEIARNLTELLGKKLRAGFAKMPVVKETGKAVPYPDQLK